MTTPTLEQYKPYKGPESYQVEDAAFFFGRREMADQIVAHGRIDVGADAPARERPKHPQSRHSPGQDDDGPLARCLLTHAADFRNCYGLHAIRAAKRGPTTEDSYIWRFAKTKIPRRQ